MSNFVYDNTPLPAAKSDGVTYDGVDPTILWRSIDGNAVFVALEDIRKLLRNQSYNVMAYGAVGDGSADDAPAIQAAIAAAAAAGAPGTYGGFVDLPKGLYVCNTPLVVPNGVGIRGAGGRGPTATIIRAGNAFNSTSLITNALKDGNQEFFFLEGIQVQGNRGGGAICSSAVVDGVSLFINTFIRDVVIVEGSNIGLRLLASGSPGGMGPVLVDNTFVVGHGGHCVYLGEDVTNTGAATGIDVYNLTAERPGTGCSAVYLQGLGRCAQFNLHNVHIELGDAPTGRTGITFDGVAYAKVDGVQLLADPATVSEGVKITNVAQNVGIEIGPIYNPNLIATIIRDQKNGVNVGAVNVSRYVTPDVLMRGGLRFIPDAGVNAKSIAFQDSGGTDRAWFDLNGRLTGNSVNGAGIDVVADAANNRAITMQRNVATGGGVFELIFPDSSNWRVRNRSGGVDLLNFDNSGVGTIYNSFQFLSQVRFNAEIAPTILGASQDNYSPTNMALANVLLLTASTPVNITGFATGAAGRVLVVYNNSANNITLVHVSGSSTTSNQIVGTGAANVVLGLNRGAVLFYSPSILKWLVILDNL